MFRDVSRSCNWETLAAELERLSVPWYDAVFEVEEDFGGMVKRASKPYRQPDFAIGLYQMILLTPPEEQITELPGYPSACLTSRPWPRVMHAQLGCELILIGLYADESHLYIDGVGRVWLHIGMIDKIEVEAGSVRVFLENVALESEMMSQIPDHAAISIDADVGGALVSPFQLQRVEEASDSVVTNWRSSSTWVRVVGSPESGKKKTLVVASSPAEVVDLVQRVVQRYPGAAVAVDTYRPGGPARLAALRKAGIKATE
ncbi:hypothetical protein [Sorangium atrum]|uniref:Uncharacterized protein n=1 Tax=Sorangium atrum TaxID=2995308 RepID=A0ABT5BWQ3_9BACT|nr:hypothetical protein [Sorangium aterium]MDC0677391.1 hypothetical protein [Sorangium aterium]